MFEISLGNAGNTTDGFQPLEGYADLSALDDTDGQKYLIDQDFKTILLLLVTLMRRILKVRIFCLNKI